MSKTDNKRSVIVGLFVLIGISILIAGVFILGGQQNRFARTVTISTGFKDVGGLKAGNNVWFSGVKVGTVKQVNFVGLEGVEVVLTIEEKSREYIRKDAIAKIGTDGFIGNRLILLEGGSHEAAPIENGDRLQAGGSTGMEAMLDTFQGGSHNLMGIVSEMKLLLERLNAGQGAVGAALNDSLMAVNMRMMIGNLQVTAANSAKASEALLHLTDKLNKKGSLVNDLLTDTVVYGNLRSAVAQLQGITQTAGALVGNLQSVTEKLDDPSNPVGLLLNDKAMTEQIKSTMKNLESSTEKLDQNMEALQHNFLFRGYFRKQAKNAGQE